MTESLETICASTLEKYIAARAARTNEYLENLGNFLWSSPEGRPVEPRQPRVEPPYVPSGRAINLLADLRAATKKGKRGKSLLAIIDAMIDEVDSEAEARYGDW